MVSAQSSVVEFKCAGDFSDYSFSDGECHVDTDGFSNSITPAESDYKLVAYYNDVEYVTPGDICFFGGYALTNKTVSMYFKLIRIYNNGGITGPLYLIWHLVI